MKKAMYYWNLGGTIEDTPSDFPQHNWYLYLPGYDNGIRFATRDAARRFLDNRASIEQGECIETSCYDYESTFVVRGYDWEYTCELVKGGKN